MSSSVPHHYHLQKPLKSQQNEVIYGLTDKSIRDQLEKKHGGYCEKLISIVTHTTTNNLNLQKKTELETSLYQYEIYVLSLFEQINKMRSEISFIKESLKENERSIIENNFEQRVCQEYDEATSIANGILNFMKNHKIENPSTLIHYDVKVDINQFIKKEVVVEPTPQPTPISNTPTQSSSENDINNIYNLEDIFKDDLYLGSDTSTDFFDTLTIQQHHDLLTVDFEKDSTNLLSSTYKPKRSYKNISLL
jgi:hypothetical protein